MCACVRACVYLCQGIRGRDNGYAPPPPTTEPPPPPKTGRQTGYAHAVATLDRLRLTQRCDELPHDLRWHLLHL